MAPMDIIDQTDEVMEQLQSTRIAEIRAMKPGLIAAGRCHNCAEPLPAGQLFCDADCRDDHEKVTAAKQRNGRI